MSLLSCVPSLLAEPLKKMAQKFVSLGTLPFLQPFYLLFCDSKSAQFLPTWYPHHLRCNGKLQDSNPRESKCNTGRLVINAFENANSKPDEKIGCQSITLWKGIFLFLPIEFQIQMHSSNICRSWRQNWSLSGWKTTLLKNNEAFVQIDNLPKWTEWTEWYGAVLVLPYVPWCSLPQKNKECPVSPIDPDRPVLSTGEVRCAIGGRLTMITTKVLRMFLSNYSKTCLKFQSHQFPLNSSAISGLIPQS